MTNDDAIRRLVDDLEAQLRIIRLRPGRKLRLTDEHGLTTGSLYYPEDDSCPGARGGALRIGSESG